MHQGTALVHESYWALADARPEYERAEAFYRGTVDEVHASPNVARLLNKYQLGHIDDFSFAHIAVDAVADLLNVNGVSADNTAIDALIEEIRDANELDEEIPDLLRNALMYGDHYLMIWPDTDDENNITGVQLRAKSPLEVRVFYSDENPLQKDYAIQSWCEGAGKDEITRVNLFFEDRVERWVHPRKPKKDFKGAKWEPYSADGIDSTLPNEFGQPFYHFRTSRTYGTPAHVATYGPQIAINKLVSAHLATVDYQAFPQRYALTDPQADLSGSQNDFDPESPEDGEQDPEHDNNSQLSADPAAVWNLQGFKEVGQFDAADPDAFLKPFDRYLRAMAQASQTPMHAFDVSGDTSGESRRQANEPLYARAESWQKSFGSVLKAAYEHALSVLGEEEELTVNWAPIRKINDREGWDLLAKKRDMGIPLDFLLMEAGYDEALVSEWMGRNPEPARPVTETPEPDEEPDAEPIE